MQRKPACLPEQLLYSGVGAVRVRAWWMSVRWSNDQCEPALESGLVEPRLAEHARGRRHVLVFPGVRGAREGELAVGEPERIGGAALDQRQCLHGLGCGARVHGRLDVAQREHHPAVAVDDDGTAAMLALDAVAARDLDGDGVGHRPILPHRAHCRRFGA